MCIAIFAACGSQTGSQANLTCDDIRPNTGEVWHTGSGEWKRQVGQNGLFAVCQALKKARQSGNDKDIEALKKQIKGLKTLLFNELALLPDNDIFGENDGYTLLKNCEEEADRLTAGRQPQK